MVRRIVAHCIACHYTAPLHSLTALNKALQQLGYAFRENLSTCKPYPLSSVVPADPADGDWNRLLQMFYELQSTCKEQQQKGIRDEILQFGDVVLEYKNTIYGIKVGGCVVICCNVFENSCVSHCISNRLPHSD